MSKQTKKKYIMIVIFLFTGFLLAMVPVEPPLFDNGDRTIVEKGHDVIFFGLHFNAAIFYELFRISEKAHRELAMAAWYKKEYIHKIIKIPEHDLNSLAKYYESENLTNIATDIRKYQINEFVYDLDLWFEFGKLLRKSKRWSDAECVYLNITQIEKNNSLGWYYLATTQMELNKWVMAENNFLQAVRLDAGLSDAHYRLGIISEKKGDFEEAKAHIVKAIEILPNHLEALRSLKRIYERK